ncbi:MarR family transcriptional regulator [Sphingobium sp. AS12]|uniref:MarR family winged helix-turn-helix transcriptional regulator n=1 Tax=Sphingobium sp. AS12 TaxID=2849495 RepID=UPI001C31B979|nr:MarR family transcriptional regulator [Sphingobium sp. AS12]MBV2150136.1 MarR family transcriptional regulator [Sphingobium sp. AS12]
MEKTLPNACIERGDPASDTFDPQAYLFFMVAQVNHWYSERISAAQRSSGADRSRWRVMMALRWKPGASLKELTELTNMQQSTISKVVDKLRRDGWVYSELGVSDSRFTHVFLTESGANVVDRLIRTASRTYRAALDGIDPQHVEVTLGLLARVLDNLRDR